MFFQASFLVAGPWGWVQQQQNLSTFQFFIQAVKFIVMVNTCKVGEKKQETKENTSHYTTEIKEENRCYQ